MNRIILWTLCLLPLPCALREGLYPSLRDAVAGMGETEAAGVLLGFVQGLLDYRTDGEQWGFEKWNFLEESLWYPAGDCDDHAILFARRVRDILGLGVVLVECRVDGVPHVTTAVRFTAPPGGDAVSFGGETWWLCEPTSLGARVARRPVGRFEITRIDQVP